MSKQTSRLRDIWKSNYVDRFTQAVKSESSGANEVSVPAIADESGSYVNDYYSALHDTFAFDYISDSEETPEEKSGDPIKTEVPETFTTAAGAASAVKDEFPVLETSAKLASLTSRPPFFPPLTLEPPKLAPTAPRPHATAISDHFFVLFPWSVVPRFVNLLTRSLNVDLVSVFCTEDFVQRVTHAHHSFGSTLPIQPIKSLHDRLSDDEERKALAYLKTDVLNLVAATCLQISWCVEKAALIVRKKARLSVFDVLCNDACTTRFAALCKFVFIDAAVNARRKHAPANVLLFMEREKQSCIDFFVDFQGMPPKNTFSKVPFLMAVNKKNAERVAAFSDPTKTQALARSLQPHGIDFEIFIRDNPGDLRLVFETCIAAFPMDPTEGSAHFTDPMYGYCLRLIDEATSRGLGYDPATYDLALEEFISFHFLTTHRLDTHVQEKLGPAALSLQKAMLAVAAVTARATQAFAWNELLRWCVTDRDRLVQFVELVAILRNFDRVADRTSAALEPVVARRMERSRQAILAWFQEINDPLSK